MESTPIEDVNLDALRIFTDMLRENKLSVGQSPMMDKNLVLFLQASQVARKIITKRLYTRHSQSLTEYFWNVWKLTLPEIEHLYDGGFASEVFSLY